MFGIGGFELFIILVAIFILFGPDKLPEVIKLAGAAIKKFRKAKEEMDQVLHEEIVDPVMREANKPDKPKESSKDKAVTFVDAKPKETPDIRKEKSQKKVSKSQTNTKKKPAEKKSKTSTKKKPAEKKSKTSTKQKPVKTKTKEDK